MTFVLPAGRDGAAGKEGRGLGGRDGGRRGKEVELTLLRFRWAVPGSSLQRDEPGSSSYAPVKSPTSTAMMSTVRQRKGAMTDSHCTRSLYHNLP